MTRARDLHKKWMKDLEYRTEYKKLGPEYELALAIITARTRAGLTQSQLAKKMKTSQSVIARLEGGGVNPSTKTLASLARATGTRLRINFEPTGGARV